MNTIEQKLRNLDQLTLEVYHAIKTGVSLVTLINKTREPWKLDAAIKLLEKKGLIEHHRDGFRDYRVVEIS